MVRTQVIPCQWEALNDRVEGAAPSYCMHNFKCAAKLNREKEKMGAAFQAPAYTYRGFEVLSDDPEHPAETESLYQPVDKVMKKPVKLRFVPYYIWANRGENEMTVWVRSADC